ncbi:MAG: arginine--tRNA ligase [Magnetococcus sp. WYHC-3]
MRHQVRHRVEAALAGLQQAGVLPEGVLPAVVIERPRDKSHGDFSTNAAMVLARLARMKPRDLAERVVAALPDAAGFIANCDIAGPGFINFRLTETALQGVVDVIEKAGAEYGRSTLGGRRRVQVEFVSANPTGPMHVGHGRGAVIGDALASILSWAGFQVEREYYINDAGAQVKTLGRSVLLRYLELSGRQVEIPAGCYPGEYVSELARALRERDGDSWLTVAALAPTDAWEVPRPVLDFAIDQVLSMIRDDLARLNIRFDTWYSERGLHEQGGVERVLEHLRQAGLIYQGVLEPPKGKKPEDWEERPQTLFRATAFGDEVDRPLQKSDGSYTYFAGDIAYHWDKAQRGYDELINVWGADHGGYVKRVVAALKALTGRDDLLTVLLMQMVNLTRDGQPVRMSKRAGTFVTLRDVVEEAGPDAVRFLFLTRSAGSTLDFDLKRAVEKSNDNPVFYVQYAHARICSVQRQREEQGWLPVDGDLGTLVLPAEMDLIRLLDQFPEVVEGAAVAREPQRVPYYLGEVAAAFHGYYNQNRILVEDPALRGARLSLCTAVRRVLANGLNLLGVSAPERM